MGSIAINENVFRSHWLCKNSCCTLATMTRPPFWFLTSLAINGQGKYRIVPESISVYSYLLQSVYITQTQWSTVCVSRCARNADTTGGVGKLRGVRGCARGTAPPAGEPSGLGGALRMRPSTAQLRALQWEHLQRNTSLSTWAGLSSGNIFSRFRFTFLFIGTSSAAGYLSTTSLWREEG